jgi:hypothetical protein
LCRPLIHQFITTERVLLRSRYMGFFSLKKKKKGVESGTNHEACGDKRDKNLSKSESSLSRGRSENKQSSHHDQQHAFPSVVRKKPILKINTTPLTPPSTPNSSPHSPKASSPVQEPCVNSQRRASAHSVHFNPDPRYPSHTPPQSPKTSLKSASPRRKSFTTLFETPKKQKLREAREGKRPAILSDNEVSSSPDSESEGQMASDVESLTEGICDPSSSTTYNSFSRRRRKSSGPLIVYHLDKDVMNVFKSRGIKMSLP